TRAQLKKNDATGTDAALRPLSARVSKRGRKTSSGSQPASRSLNSKSPARLSQYSGESSSSRGPDNFLLGGNDWFLDVYGYTDENRRILDARLPADEPLTKGDTGKGEGYTFGNFDEMLKMFHGDGVVENLGDSLAVDGDMIVENLGDLLPVDVEMIVEEGEGVLEDVLEDVSEDEEDIPEVEDDTHEEAAVEDLPEEEPEEEPAEEPEDYDSDTLEEGNYTTEAEEDTPEEHDDIPEDRDYTMDEEKDTPEEQDDLPKEWKGSLVEAGKTILDSKIEIPDSQETQESTQEPENESSEEATATEELEEMVEPKKVNHPLPPQPSAKKNNLRSMVLIMETETASLRRQS
ncbi:hypothetical protein RUND412_006258, partial [Rhizina undulata]